MNSDYLVGTVLENRYEILEMIGSGGMATVYKARCRVLNRFVAIKVLKDSLKYDKDIVKRFNAESRAAACLSHSNIVQVHDVSEKGELDYIVMEYVDGITLKDYIAKKGKLNWKEAASFALQICKALDCAHKNHIIHRDIKPHNILMTKDGVLKVADFGIAQATSSDTIVAGSSNMGSVHYISPEQGRGGFIDEKSDIYSLGVVLYEMLTGKVPFDGANPVTIAIMKLENDPVDCRIINPDIPLNIGQITMKAISKEQHARYQSASEMIKDLENVIKNSSVEVTSYEDSRNFETNRIDKDKTREEYYMRKESKKRRKTAKTTVSFVGILVAIAVFLGVGTYLFMSGGRQEYQVPDLRGYTIEEAEEILKDANLLLSDEIEYEESDEFDDGQIINQKPGANQFVKKNRKIKVVVCMGAEDKTEVPDVVDIPVEKAKKKLEQKDLDYTIIETYDETVEIGYVISQSPKSGVEVKKGEKVTLTVCAKEEEEQAVVPRLTGSSEAQAKALIEEAGLVVGTIDKEENSAAVGTVIAQNPAAKTGVEKGSKVNITISSGEAEKPVLKRKTLTITIPDDANDSVQIKVIANGKTIHDKAHQKSEGTVDIEVQASKDASVQAYIDGKLVVDKVISFD